MTVLPGSLDNLYYNGILDHIPYEAYEYGMGMPNSGMINPYSGLKQSFMMNGTQYLNSAQQGLSYRTYTGDTFVNQVTPDYRGGYYDNAIAYNPYGSQIGVGAGNGSGLNPHSGMNACDGNSYNKAGQSGMNFREKILSAASSAKESVMNSPSLWKGLLATGLVVLTPILIIKGRKRPPIQTPKQSFWSKLNPFNWFKK